MLQSAMDSLSYFLTSKMEIPSNEEDFHCFLAGVGREEVYLNEKGTELSETAVLGRN